MDLSNTELANPVEAMPCTKHVRHNFAPRRPQRSASFWYDNNVDSTQTSRFQLQFPTKRHTAIESLFAICTIETTCEIGNLHGRVTLVSIATQSANDKGKKISSPASAFKIGDDR